MFGADRYRFDRRTAKKSAEWARTTIEMMSGLERRAQALAEQRERQARADELARTVEKSALRDEARRAADEERRRISALFESTLDDFYQLLTQHRRPDHIRDGVPAWTIQQWTTTETRQYTENRIEHWERVEVQRSLTIDDRRRLSGHHGVPVNETTLKFWQERLAYIASYIIKGEIAPLSGGPQLEL